MYRAVTHTLLPFPLLPHDELCNPTQRQATDTRGRRAEDALLLVVIHTAAARWL